MELTLNRGAGLDLSSDGDLIRAYCGFLFRVGRIREAMPLLERVWKSTTANSAGTISVALSGLKILSVNK